ncbi:SRPBCC family protein [Skermania piniformis]|uniref:SRPBCC family protein n=1 Tax=Skermania pinensis TaxID=39122 RepID=A0ABX8SDH7_9ACTN|nr:SRPBCC family protein [Skermania piniformis]QXQ14490.1 SRPBCC family protein [Skermania piniformis]
MNREWQVSDSVVVVGVDPLTAYENISDVTRMARWSPENTGATVPEPGAPAVVGMRFTGTNRRGPVLRWVTESVVTAADPGERFAWAVRRYGFGRPLVPVAIASWEYRFEAVPGGTRITEIWTDDRRSWPDPVAAVFDRIATRRSGFAEFQRGNIRRTLDRLHADLGR